MEALARLVGAVGAVLAGGVPVRIDHRAAQLVVGGLEPFTFAVLLHHGGTMLAAYMEGKLAGVGLVGGMAVVAQTACLRVLDDGRLVKVGKVALVDTHLAVHLVAGSYAAVGKSPFLQFVRTYPDVEVLVLGPFPALLYTYGDREFAALVLCQQVVPLVYLKFGMVAVGVQLAASCTFYHDIHRLAVAARIVEVEGGNAYGYRYPCVVGEYLGQAV